MRDEREMVIQQDSDQSKAERNPFDCKAKADAGREANWIILFAHGQSMSGSEQRLQPRHQPILWKAGLSCPIIAPHLYASSLEERNNKTKSISHRSFDFRSAQYCHRGYLSSQRSEIKPRL
jgi:hypothetical protein